MPNSIKHQIASLVKVQALDVEINDIQSLVNGVPEKISALDDELEAFEQEMAAEGTHIDELKKIYRDQEHKVQDNIVRMKKSQVTLGIVKNNKEYQSTLKEIEDFKAKNSAIEDEMLENLDQVDIADQSIAEKKETYGSLSEQIKSDKEHLKQEVEECGEKLVRLAKERNDTICDIGPELLDTFNAVKSKQGGRLAVVPVSDSVCNGCNVNLPPQLYNELQRSDTLRFCPNCQRIIYWLGE
jgi:predicted  nucleic acid-binding Zn-ribbon protein